MRITSSPTGQSRGNIPEILPFVLRSRATFPGRFGKASICIIIVLYYSSLRIVSVTVAIFESVYEFIDQENFLL